MPPEIVTAAAGVLGKIAAEPVKTAAMHRASVINALKRLHLDPSRPPKDFESLYAYALVEELYGRPRPILLLFQDQYVQRAFQTSFESGDWSQINREVNLAVERNRESGEFGHLGVDVEETLTSFISRFQDLVNRSRDAHDARLEQKVDALLEQVMKTRNAEEAHRLAEEPGRADARPDMRLRDDVRAWFTAVGYQVEQTWAASGNTSALLVHVPTRRPGRFDRVIVLCVDGELGLYHLDVLENLVQEYGAAEGWGVAQLRISEAARRRAADSQDRYSCFSFDELIDMEVDFEPYIDWLQNEVSTRKIDTRYIPLSCKKEEVDLASGKPLDVSHYHWSEGGLDRYVETWLTDPAKKHLSLLGEFGMGKSWFSLHFASQLAEAWKDAKKRGVPRPRVPLVIPLRDYAKQTSVSALLSEFFFNKHKIGMRSYDVFSVLNRMGRLLLIFDGFDEMASRIDRNTMVANFWELAKAVEPGAKVLLSSRTEHFPEAKHARDLFEARISTSASSAIPTDGPTFEIVELVPFDDDQIERLLGNLLSPDQVRSVMRNDDVRDLMQRPVMSELVMDALPAIESGAPVNLTRVYLYAVQRKMDKDVSSQRTFTSRADKLLFLSEVSWEMLRTNQLTLNYRDFPDKLRACFGSVVESSKDLDYWEQDMRNQGMFVRNAEGDYGPSHKSLLEFLTAYKYAAELGLLAGDFLALIPKSGHPGDESYSWWEYFNSRGNDGALPQAREIRAESPERLVETFGVDEFNPVVYDFLATIAREHSDFEKVLIGHIQSTKDLDSPGALGGNCANLIGCAEGSLEGANLDRVDLTGFRRVERPRRGMYFARPKFAADQRKMSLRGASLRQSVLNSVNLASLDLRGVDFSDANLKNSSFLVSSRRIFRGVIHPQGTIGAIVVDDFSSPGSRSILRWRDGDLNENPVEIPLRTPGESEDLWEGVRYFLGTSADWWGYSDGLTTFIVSTAGEVLDRIEGCGSRVIRWGDRDALITSARGNSARWGWRVLDLQTHALIVEVGDVDVEDATHFTYFEHDEGLRVWARGARETSILHFGPGSPEWLEIGVIPAGHGQSLNEDIGRGDVMISGGVAYFATSAGEVLSFAENDIESASAQLSECESYVFAREADYVLVRYGKVLSVWKTKPGVWEEVWVAKFGAQIDGISLSPDESRVLITCQSGELFMYSLPQGELLSGVSLNPHLLGATFSGSELSEEEVMAIRRAGATVVK
ncbi:NACHT domain-containing protein [Streptomyces sp. NBC_00269]|uniref:NACHT domain-containing protein n=1 Tax=Streptomyces sp. NBC_00269 TaxID=2975696 RepID=UPI002E2A4BE7|nr:NACHT domain-containing protein [Streptomyces sp. NBC_00269]